MSTLYSDFRKWVEETPMSAGLKNSLRLFNSIYPVKQPEEITKEELLSLKGVGIGRWNEFAEVREKW